METRELEGGTIRTMGYENGVLQIDRQDGTVIRYSGIEEDVWKALQRAWRPERYLALNIEGRYEKEAQA